MTGKILFLNKKIHEIYVDYYVVLFTTSFGMNHHEGLGLVHGGLGLVHEPPWFMVKSKLSIPVNNTVAIIQCLTSNRFEQSFMVSDILLEILKRMDKTCCP